MRHIDLTSSKGGYRDIFSLAWPVMVEEGLQTAVTFVDTALVGHLGAWASAAVGISQSPMWLIWGLLRVVSLGLMPYISQAIGARDHAKVRRTGGQIVLYTLVVGAVVGIIACSIAHRVPGWMGVDPSIKKIAGQYFFMVCTPMVFRSIIANFGACIRATGDMRTPMLVNFLVNVIHVTLSFFLIYPTRDINIFGVAMRVFGFDLGIIGSAVSGIISVTVGGLVMTAALFKNDLITPKGSSLRLDKEILRYCAKIAAPGAAQHIIVTSGFITFASLVSRLGTISFAAHTVANTAEQAFYIPAYGLQGVSTTLIGIAAGQGDHAKLDLLTQRLSRMAFAVLAVLGAVLFILPRQMMGLFTTDPQVIEMGITVLRIVAVVEPFFGVFVVAEGIMRGVGNLKPTMYISLGCMWGVRILFTFISLKYLSGGLTAVWICMSADNLCRFACYTYMLKSGRWKRTLPPPEAEAQAAA